MAACSFPNPNYDQGPTSESAASSNTSSTDDTRTGTEATTVDPGTGTIDPTTVDPSETTEDVGTSPASETETETDSETESDTEDLPDCIEPPDPDFAIEVIDLLSEEPAVFPCGPNDEIKFLSEWKDGYLLIKECPGCNGCVGPATYKVEVDVPQGDPELAFDSSKIPEEQCLVMDFDAALETPDPNWCLVSGLVLRDASHDPRFVAVDHQLHRPASLLGELDLDLDTQPCKTCDADECCDSPEPGTSILNFTSNYLEEPVWIEPGDDAPVTFFDRPGKAKNYRSTITPLCEPPAYTWVISTLPLNN